MTCRYHLGKSSAFFAVSPSVCFPLLPVFFLSLAIVRLLPARGVFKCFCKRFKSCVSLAWQLMVKAGLAALNRLLRRRKQYVIFAIVLAALMVLFTAQVKAFFVISA